MNLCPHFLPRCAGLILIMFSLTCYGQANYVALYKDNCAVCHGENLEGAAQGVPLNGKLQYGDTVTAISNSINNGFAASGMPGWGEILSPSQVKNIALFITEARANLSYSDFNITAQLDIPTTTQQGEVHAFNFRTITAQLDPLPYSIAPLPDGSIVVTEKKRGVRLVAADGKLSPLIEGTPKPYDDSYTTPIQLEYGQGWLLDVAPHPQYENNGWVYLSFGDRCSDCNTISKQSKQSVSMVKLVRGRIKNNRWVDEEVIYAADKEHYGPSPDIAAGGRITFDNRGHVFFSVGVKGIDNHKGIQDLGIPWGKIFRLHEDGAIPKDNPFVNTPNALPGIWSYGHRSPQGLEFNHATGQLWETEMGPRGGDEVNLIGPGLNYGWPLYSLGLDYDGTPVEYGKDMNIEFDLKDIQQPIVDLSPSPAVSSFIIYTGEQFPKWKNNLLVGSLKARSIYRMVLEDNKVVHQETIVKDLARIRDIEQGPKGEIYVLLEHQSGGRIVQLLPQ